MDHKVRIRPQSISPHANKIKCMDCRFNTIELNIAINNEQLSKKIKTTRPIDCINACYY